MDWRFPALRLTASTAAPAQDCKVAARLRSNSNPRNRVCFVMDGRRFRALPQCIASHPSASAFASVSASASSSAQVSEGYFCTQLLHGCQDTLELVQSRSTVSLERKSS